MILLVQDPLPGERWLARVKNPAVRAGLLTGAYLSATMIVAILAATRMNFLEPYANFRNWAFRAAFAAVALIPVFLFARQPLQMFTSAVTGWFVFAVSYGMMGFFFRNLYTRLDSTPFHAFFVGATVYGAIGVALWVAEMFSAARTTRLPLLAAGRSRSRGEGREDRRKRKRTRGQK